MNWTWRALSVEDAGAIAELLRAAEAVEPTHEHYSVEDVREELTAPNVRLPDGSVSVWDGERLAGYAMAVPREEANPEHRLRVELQVRPGYRELGKQLVEWLLVAGPKLHEQTFPQAPLELHARSHENQRWYAKLLDAAGFERSRSFATMRADLRGSVMPHDLPEDLRLAGHGSAREDAPRRAVGNLRVTGHGSARDDAPRREVEDLRLTGHGSAGEEATRREVEDLRLTGHGSAREQTTHRALNDLRLVGYDADQEEATRLALNEAFRGHWGMTAYSPELFRHRVTGKPAFRPESSFLLLTDGGEVVSFVLSAFYESDAEATGVRELQVSYVGTRAARRGRGVATALLAHTLNVAREQGYERAALGVDESNVHNALEIYRRVGFEVFDRQQAHTRRMP